MKAMILAAGKGTRMRPVSLERPKPLVEVAGKTLLEHQIERLADAGIVDIIINVSYMAEMIQQQIGDGSQWGVNIRYSEEESALETAGAILHARSLLGDAPFILVNSDIWLEYPLDQLIAIAKSEAPHHLVLVDNPPYHPGGDFALEASHLSRSLLRAKCPTKAAYTFAGLSVLSVGLVEAYQAALGDTRKKFPLKPVFTWAIEVERLTGEAFDGFWVDVGTPERLRFLSEHLAQLVD